MTHEMMVSIVRYAAHSVFETMLGVTLKDCEATRGENAPIHSEGVCALVGLAGDWAGTGTFRCSAEMAQKLSGLMLMQEYSSVDQDVLDAVGEITNMILGNVKTTFEETLGPMGLSIPTVIYGRNFTTRSVGRVEWSVIPFELDGGSIEIQISLAKSTPKAPSSNRKDRLSTMVSMNV